MTPAQFLARVRRNELPPVCLFLGQEGYNRRRCHDAVIKSVPHIESERHDAGELSLAAIIDDARSMSLFASERLIFVMNAEAAMPRSSRSAAASDDDDEESAAPVPKGDTALLEAYVKSPTPGATLIFEATRWDFEGDDKTKIERVRKYYGAIAEVVEFRRFTADEARTELDRIARAANVKLGPRRRRDAGGSLSRRRGPHRRGTRKLSLYGNRLQPTNCRS